MPAPLSLWTMVVACWEMWQLKSFTSMARQNFCPAAGLVGLNCCGNQLLMREHVCFLYAQNYSICGLEGMKTTYEKDSFYYAGEGTKTGAPGYEYSNLIFQTGSHCYYTSYDHCVGEKGIKITQFDDG